MKASFEWDEQDLLDLIKIGARESNVLEFKSCAALGKGKGLEVAKDVSAFANAGGGTIVYGVIENKDTHTAAARNPRVVPAGTCTLAPKRHFAHMLP